MIRPRDRKTATRLDNALDAFSKTDTPLLGICNPDQRQTLIAQLIESMRRVEFIVRLREKHVSVECANPHNPAFNPIKAAIYHTQHDAFDEACWLVFLLTHFGKHTKQGWSLMKAVYGKLGAVPFWSWQEISSNEQSFRVWLKENQAGLSGLGFGNHRKYESTREDSSRGLASVIESYVNWITPTRNHDEKIRSVIRGINDPHSAFDALYRDTSALFRWGRLAKFDHLTMLAKLGLLEINPGSTYLTQATGPRRGAALLLHNSTLHPLDIESTEKILLRMGDHLEVGQQEIEDSICNWQKSPQKFIPFR